MIVPKELFTFIPWSAIGLGTNEFWYFWWENYSDSEQCHFSGRLLVIHKMDEGNIGLYKKDNISTSVSSAKSLIKAGCFHFYLLLKMQGLEC